MDKYFFLTISLLFNMLNIFAQPDSTIWDLERCIGYAVENNLTVKQAELTKATADINYRQAKNNFLPTLSASASQIFNNGSNIDQVNGGYYTTSSVSTSLGANMSVSFYTGGRQLHELKQNGLVVKQNQEYVNDAKNNIILSILEAYIQAVYYREGIVTAQNNYDASLMQVEQAKAKYQIGSIAALALADIESQLATNQYQLVMAKNNYNAQELVLKQLLEFGPGLKFEITAPNIDADTLVIENKTDIYNKALSFMPQVQASKMQIDINQKDILIARSGYYPTVSLSGGVNAGYTSNDPAAFGTQLSGKINENINISLNIPLFSKLSNNSAVSKAKIAVDKSRVQLATEQKNLYQKIEQAWQNAVASQSEMRSVKVSKNAAFESYTLAQQQFANGALSSTDLLVSQNNYLNAEQNYLQTKYSCLLYYLLLKFYSGQQIKI